MNLVEAMRSGKRFKHFEMTHWIPPLKFHQDNGHTLSLSISNSQWIDDLWSIEEEKLELSWKQIMTAIQYARNIDTFDLELIKSSLGFKKE